MECVYCAVRFGCLNIIQVNLFFEGCREFHDKSFALKHMRTAPLGGVCVCVCVCVLCTSNHLVEKSRHLMFDLYDLPHSSHECGMKYQLKAIVLPSHVSQLRRLSDCVGRTGMLREIRVATVDVTYCTSDRTSTSLIKL